MVIWNYSLFWIKNPNFGPKNAGVIKNMQVIQTFLDFMKVLLEC